MERISSNWGIFPPELYLSIFDYILPTEMVDKTGKSSIAILNFARTSTTLFDLVERQPKITMHDILDQIYRLPVQEKYSRQFHEKYTNQMNVTKFCKFVAGICATCNNRSCNRD